MSSRPRLPGLQALPLPADVPAGVEVWHLQLDLPHDPPDDWLAVLPPCERARCLRYRQPADRLRYAAARLALRQLLAERLNSNPSALQIEPDAHGKPGLRNAPHWQFNLSHAGQQVLIALSRAGPVGIDTEALPPPGSRTDLLASLAAPERTFCQRRADASSLLQVWCGKEAVLKALGLGLDPFLMQQTVVLPSHGSRYLVRLPPAATPVRAWPLPAPPGHAAALALSEPVAAMLGQDAEMPAKRR